MIIIMQYVFPGETVAVRFVRINTAQLYHSSLFTEMSSIDQNKNKIWFSLSKSINPHLKSSHNIFVVSATVIEKQQHVRWILIISYTVSYISYCGLFSLQTFHHPSCHLCAISKQIVSDTTIYLISICTLLGQCCDKAKEIHIL